MSTFCTFQMEDNPWNVEHFDEFLFYICPECNYFTKELEVLVDHAEDLHSDNYSKVKLQSKIKVPDKAIESPSKFTTTSVPETIFASPVKQSDLNQSTSVNSSSMIDPATGFFTYEDTTVEDVSMTVETEPEPQQIQEPENKEEGVENVCKSFILSSDLGPISSQLKPIPKMSDFERRFEVAKCKVYMNKCEVCKVFNCATWLEMDKHLIAEHGYQMPLNKASKRKRSVEDKELTKQCEYCESSIYYSPHDMLKHLNEKHDIVTDQGRPEKQPKMKSEALKHKEEIGMESCPMSTCAVKTFGPDEKKLHIEEHLKEKECSVCDTKFTYYSALLQHLRFPHFIETNLQCDECDSFRASTVEELSKHKTKVHSAIPMELEIIRNRTTHYGNIPQRTPKLGTLSHPPEAQVFLPQEIFDKTERRFEGPWECYLCNDITIFTTKADLKQHYKTVHKAVDGGFSCPIQNCTTRFGKLRYFLLLEHVAIVHGRKMSFQCEKCLKTFDLPIAYKEHKRRCSPYDIRPGHGPFQCYFCGQIEKTLLKLGEHMKSRHGLQDPDNKLGGKQGGLNLKSLVSKQYAYGKPKRASLQCGNCKRVFINQWNKEIHLCNETDPEWWLTRQVSKHCDECGQTFETLNGFLEHRIVTHVSPSDRLLKCQLCPFYTYEPMQFLQHVSGVHNKIDEYEEYICKSKTCKFKTYDREAHRNHQEMHKCSYDDVICDICYYVIPKLKIKAHKEKDHNVPCGLHMCMFCDYDAGLGGTGGLAKHIDANHSSPDAMYHCQHCDKSYNTAYGLEVHNKGVHGSKEWYVPCPQCKNCFTTYAKTGKHIKKNHQKIFICTICNIISSSEVKLIEHINQVHMIECTEENSYICAHDQSKFSTIEELSDHLSVVHQHPKEDKCEQCDRIYSSKIALSIHIMERHYFDVKPETLPNNVSPAIKSQFQNLPVMVDPLEASGAELNKVQCPHCKKWCSGDRTLKMHIRQVHRKDTHTLACPHCNFTTFENYKMMKHIEAHGKNFKCDRCDKRFGSKSLRTQHIRKDHENIKYLKCSLCPKGYNEIRSLKKHMWDEHSIVYKIAKSRRYQSE